MTTPAEKDAAVSKALQAFADVFSSMPPTVAQGVLDEFIDQTNKGSLSPEQKQADLKFAEHLQQKLSLPTPSKTA